MKILYKNRYGDVYTFTKLDEGVLLEGSFKWCRFGYPNVYDKAYEEYCKDTAEPISLEDFKRVVHHYDADTFEAGKIAKKYASLVYSDKDRLNMMDPSGGPYLHEDMDLKYISPKFQGLIIDSFVPHKKGYLIKLKNGRNS